jgi:hypothetical protein
MAILLDLVLATGAADRLSRDAQRDGALPVAS